MEEDKEIGKLIRRLIATEYKDKELTIYKRALELACENIRDMYCSDYCVRIRDENCKGKCYYEQYYNKGKLLDQAEKELEKGGQK